MKTKWTPDRGLPDGNPVGEKPQYRFEIQVRCPFRKLVPAVASVEDSVNASMSGFGFSEKMVITSIVPLVLTTGRPPTDSEWAVTRAAIEKEFTDRFGPSTVESIKALP